MLWEVLGAWVSVIKMEIEWDIDANGFVEAESTWQDIDWTSSIIKRKREESTTEVSGP